MFFPCFFRSFFLSFFLKVVLRLFFSLVLYMQSPGTDVSGQRSTVLLHCPCVLTAVFGGSEYCIPVAWVGTRER